MKQDPFFLTLVEVIEIHRSQIELYGGSLGVRDIHLLQSAMAQPEASFWGEWLHEDLFEMAAAYAFHLCQNHPFIDGNKRVALASVLVFLEINGITIVERGQELAEAVLGMASAKMSKKDFATILRNLS